jgi:hypothetical protein
MAEAYTRAADQKRLAESAMHMLEVQQQHRIVSHQRSEWSFFRNRTKSILSSEDGAQERAAIRQLHQELTLSHFWLTSH